MRSIPLLLLLLVLTLSIPTNFDLRVQTQRIKYTNYDLQTEGICAGYAWAKEISQVVSNAVGLYESLRTSLSAQQILDCTESQTDICYKATLEDIHSAIKRLQLQGITTTDCYPNKPFSFPNAFCRRQCHDGSSISFNYFPLFKRYYKFDDIVTLFKTDENIAVMAVIKVDNAFNYYSPFNQVLTQGGPKTFYEYRVAEVVGWKDAQKNVKVILRAGPGEQWGFNGFIDLELERYGKYIVEYYAVKVGDEGNLRTA